MLDKIFLKNSNYEILRYEENKNIINVYVKSKLKKCICPMCKKESDIYHSTYVRTIQDTPIHNTQTWLQVCAYEFECNNSECEVKTFTEELPFARKNKVKTDALMQLILSISMFLSATTASMILSFLGVKISADSISNIINNIDIKDNPDVEEIGIDDVAIRKGQTYATAIYDLKDHHLIALLNGRDAETVKQWLQSHKKIKVVARDRASAYATAISEILPNCIQVADRFHLFENLIKYLKDIFYQEMPEKIYIKDNEIVDKSKLKKEPIPYKTNQNVLDSLNYDNTLPTDKDGNVIVFDNKRHNLDSKQYKEQGKRRIEKMEMVKRLKQKVDGITNIDIKSISQEFNISIPTAKKYINMSDEEVNKICIRKNYKKRKTVLDDYINMIYKMIVDNIAPEYIINYVVQKGYKGKLRNIEQYIVQLVQNNNITYDYSKIVFKQYRYPSNVLVVTRYDLLKHILTIDENKKDKKIEENIEVIINQYPIVAQIKDIFYEFHETIFSKEPNNIENFINKYQETLPSFCNGLKKDIAAVKNAISNHISSGFVEGNNNKFKLIKRIVYGKMKIVNLFKKSFLCFSATSPSFDIRDIVDGILNNNKK